MQFGVCTGIENAEIARSAGFAFIEPTVRSLHGGKDFSVIQASHAAAGLPTPTFNVFVPGDLKITGPTADLAKLQIYVAESLRRVKSVGGELVVFGSGGARNIPDGFSRDVAWQQLIDFLQMVAGECEQSGVSIAIEPLNRKESNVINSVAEGVELAKAVDRPPIRVLADLYHMEEDAEPTDTVVENAVWLTHVHVADSGRLAPGSGSYPYAEFFGYLKSTGYSGRIAVECKWQDFEAEAGPAVAYLYKMWDQAG
ncbi:MAG: sugar phosphate isomerase/epimerase [Caldilineaceae bacterium]|nr:sugar phosphate isomerase/epimerase [Caldilineaceae bacterium]